jgi:DNA primase
MATLTEFKETVRQQADIVRVVGEYVKLKKSGAQNFSGLCPFHQEKTPSFSVNVTRQFFHCFGCGKHGDVFKFLQEREQISFPEAVRLVAEKAGIPLPKMQYATEGEARDARQRGQLLEAQERACKFFEEQLRRPEGAHARQYLSNRGISDEMIRVFRIGYAPDSGFVLKDRLKGEFDEDLLRASGLFAWKEEAPGNIYSKFRNRVTFPIANEQGKVIAFTGRTLATDEKAGPKYLNSPETAIYSKSRVLFNLDKAKEAIRRYKFTIIVEGQMDCIAAYSAGFHNVVASSGTAFSETQVRTLGRFSKDIVINFDPDTAGAAATDRSLALLVAEEFRIKILRLEEGYDPDLFIRKRGAEAYTRALKSAPYYFDYLVDRALHQFPAKTPEAKKNAVNYLLPHIQNLPSRIERESLANDIAQKLGIDSAVLRQEFKAAATRRGTREVKAAAATQITPAEKVVIRAICSAIREESALRRAALEALSQERLHTGLSTEALLQLLLENALLENASPEHAGFEPNGDAGHRQIHTDDLMSLPLAEADQQVLAALLMEEDEPLTAELLEGALSALRSRRLVQREQEIKRAIVDAERNNDLPTLLRLKQEKLEIDRKLAEE